MAFRMTRLHRLRPGFWSTQTLLLAAACGFFWGAVIAALIVTGLFHHFGCR